MNARHILIHDAHWNIAGQIPDAGCEMLLKAAMAIDTWLGPSTQPLLNLSKLMGGTRWMPSPLIWRQLGFHHVELSTVFFDPTLISFETAIHEIGHLLDNMLGSHPLSSIFGGGPSDDLARYVGIEPEIFFPRFHAPGYEKLMKEMGLELNPTEYGRANGPAEDFAESFKLVVTDPETLSSQAPLRYNWFERWRVSLVNRLEKRN